MRRFRTILAFPLVATVWAQQVGPPQPDGLADDLKPCTVEGVVVKATTGEALRKATVILHLANWSRPGQQTLTGSDGRFIFLEVPPGRYRLQAQAIGYEPRFLGQRSPRDQGAVLTLAPGCQLRDVELRLQPPGAISGTVLDEDGDPLMQATVAAFRVQPNSHSRRWASMNHATTNDRGEYRLYHLPSGRYYLVARAELYVPDPQSPRQLRYLGFYPDSTDPGQAIAVELGPGQELAGTDIRLRPTTGASIRGRVVRPEQAGDQQSAYVTLQVEDLVLGADFVGGYGASAHPQTGEFEIRDVPPGEYTLTAAIRRDQRVFTSSVRISVDTADIEGLTLTLTPAVDISGRVRADSPEYADFAGLYLTLSAARNPQQYTMGTRVIPDGTFTLPNVPAGHYRVRLQGFPQEFYVKSGTLGGADILGPGLAVGEVGSAGTIELFLASDGGRIEGTVAQEGKPAGGVAVVLVPDPPDRERFEKYSVTRSDESGTYSLPGLPPGDYKLFAWEEIEHEAYLDSEFLRPFEHLGRPVRVSEGNLSRMDLEIIPGEDDVR